MFRTVTRIGAVDERLRNLLAQGKIFIFYYSPRGQEIIPAAVTTCLQPDDYVVTTYRGLHDEVAKGAPLKEILAEIMGRATGSCRGKGGPMHISDPRSGLMVTTGVVGSGMPIANGLALASMLKGDGRVTVVNFGDGAANIGAFHESLNLAAVWSLPVVFVLQNNRYGEFTPISETQTVEHLSTRAAGYGIPGVTVNGNDAEAMYAAAREAVDRARRGDGPTLLECMTYRFMGHFFGDQMTYMDQEELQAAVAADPVPRLRALLLERGHATEEELAVIEAEAATEADEAVEYALSSPPPDPAELFEDVYAEVVAR
ncbi:MAG: thiamine pyrophosphate-dependent dehydrogenase E1 component subunit alpha [Acidimicrobiia bacterium]